MSETSLTLVVSFFQDVSLNTAIIMAHVSRQLTSQEPAGKFTHWHF